MPTVGPAAAVVGLPQRDPRPAAARPMAARVLRRAGRPARARHLGAHRRGGRPVKVKMTDNVPGSLRPRQVVMSSCSARDRIRLHVPLSPQAHCGPGRRRGRHLALAQARARRRRPGHARHRRGHRRRHLRRHRHGGGRAGGARRRRHPLRRGPGAGVLVPAAGRGVRAGGAVLRGAGVDDPAGRVGLRLHLRDAGRGGGLDHRLGPDPRVRGGQRRRGDLVGRLLHDADARGRRGVSGLAHDRLPHGAAEQQPRRPRPAAVGAARGRHPDPGEPARLRHRRARHLAAAARRQGERARQQHHGGDQAGGAGAVCRRRAHQPEHRQLHAVCAQRLHRHPSGRGHRLFRLHRLRRDLDGGRRDAGPATQPAHRHPRRAGHLHADLRGRGLRADGHGARTPSWRTRPTRWPTRCSRPASAASAGWSRWARRCR